MVREILYTVTENTKEITPATKQWAGMQYEDNATEVIFDLSALKDKLKNPLYRVDFNSSSAGYQPSENLDISDNKISRKLPLAITQYGGEVQITAVITETNDNGEETGVLYSYPVTVYFTAVKKSAIGESKVVANISAMEESIKKMEQNAKASVEEIIDYSKYEMGAEWIFDGGNSEDNLDLDVILDRQMSDESANPVMNKVIKKYIDDNTKALKKYVDDNTIVDEEMSNESNNPVMNKVIKKYIDDNTVVDEAMSEESGNPVMNKVVKKYIDDNTIVDEEISAESTNPVMNKVVKKYIDENPERGKSEIWNYAKWPNGDFECWCNITHNVEEFKKAGSVWFATWELKLPFVSTTTPIGWGSSFWHFGNWVNVSPEASEAKSNTIYSKVVVMLYQTQETTGQRRVFVNVKGTWK